MEARAVSAKCYTYRLANGYSDTRLKGVPKYISRQLNMSHFEAVSKGARISANFNMLKSKKHSVQLVTMSKRALKWGDDKSFARDSGRYLSHGHYLSPSFKQVQKSIRPPPTRVYAQNAVTISVSGGETQF
mmetsp:Transcript_19821/g.50436  ORF Transcript_19821/g.50436 Transcript_19821/m.50436 type:complete len:131 (+) Transcript_19821:349-741(+)